MTTEMKLDLAGRHILVVEDEFLTADEMAQTFEGFGARVVGPVPTVERALSCIKEAARLDGAVLDVNLRGELVFPVADALCQRGVRFVFATGYDRRIIPERHRAMPCCEKPVDPRRLVQVLFG